MLVIRRYIFLFLLFHAVVAVNAQNVQQYLLEAKKCFEKGDYDCAIKKYQAWAELSEKNVGAAIEKVEICRSIKQSADKYYENKDYEKACAEYERLLTRNPNDTYAKQQKEKCCPLSETDEETIVTLPTDPLQLGRECYQNKNYKDAVRWFRKSAEQGDIVGQNNLGLMYEKGLGVKKDDKEAVRWYKKSAERGFDIAQYNLGLMYDYGRGVKKNHKEAERWYMRSANQGNREAINILKK